MSQINTIALRRGNINTDFHVILLIRRDLCLYNPIKEFNLKIILVVGFSF